MRSFKEIKLVLCAAVLLGLSSMMGCKPLVQEVDDDLLSANPKLVVYGLISPQNEVNYIEVTESLPVIRETDGFFDEFEPVDDAVVVLSNGATSVTLPYNTDRERFELAASDFPIETGVAYALTVEGNGKSVSATCMIPEINENLTHELREISRDYDTHEIVMTIADVAGEENFYYADAAVKTEDGTYTNSGSWEENNAFADD